MTCSDAELRERTEEREGRAAAAGKTLVVGMKMDAVSRELLTWALVKVANAGDRVIAMHVLPPAAKVPEPFEKPSSLISIVKDFDNVLAVYEGFCNLKQIELKLKICRGSSVRKILVHEATRVSASKIILGVSKSINVISLSTLSVAKFCANKLSRGCLVLAVSNGKIVFEKEATGNNCTDDLLQRSGSAKLHNINVEPGKNVELNASGKSLSFDKTKISPSFRSLEKEGSTISDNATFKPEFLPSTDSEDLSSSDSPRTLVPVKENESSVGSAPRLIPEPPDKKPSWLLLRRSVLSFKKSATPDKLKRSVTQLAMRLPSQHFASSVVHPDQKQSKSEPTVKSGFNEDATEIDPLSPASLFEVKALTTTMLSRIPKYSSNCRQFSFDEVMQATSNFLPANIIGRGGSCKVYKGCLPDGKELAFKFLRRCDAVLLEDFISEIEIITNLNHRNIISLYGFCFENHHLVLVYDFLSKGSLEENLHGVKGKKNDLGWADRFKIAVGVADALDYIHSDVSREPVIHRDVKSSNILLADDYEPQLCDFGLAQCSSSSSIQNSEETDSSDLAGTFGYLAPEYFIYGKVDEKIDVYAFGVVLLELLSGRKPVCTGCPKGEESLVMWARPILLGGEHDQLLDPSLGENYNIDEMERMCLAAALCISQASRSRPSSALVLKLLRGEGEAVEWARSELSASAACDDSEDRAVVLLHRNIQSHINLALLDLDEDGLSSNSMDDSMNFVASNTSLEDYLKARCCQ